VVRYPFVAANRELCRKVELWLTRVRRHDVTPPDEALGRFYAERLTGISSLHELNAFLKTPSAAASLEATEADIAGDETIDWDDTAFPERVTVSGQVVSVTCPLRSLKRPTPRRWTGPCRDCATVWRWSCCGRCRNRCAEN
jgi:hypothetical protein